MNDTELTLEQAQQRIAELEQELAELRAQLRLTMNASIVTGLPVTGIPESSTISGLEEMVLLVHADRTVGFLNSPMARLLGLPERREALGEPLARIDGDALGEGTLSALVASALAAEQTLVVERDVPGLATDRLPSGSGERPAGDPTLRFVAVPMKGRVQITVQDVTRLRWLEQTFSRFVSPRVIQQMLASTSDEFLAMQRREISMLYADLRGFTRLSQTLPLDTVQAMMAAWFSAMQDCVEQHGGTVGQFVGDQVVALFGAPVPREDHALCALLAACDMQEAQRELRRQWGAREWPRPGAGIGLSTGVVAVGNMGTERLMYYTALGHSMNLGARLCASAESGEILTIPQTHSQALAALKTQGEEREVPHIKFRSRGVYRFKNVLDPVEVLEVLRVENAK